MCNASIFYKKNMIYFKKEKVSNMSMQRKIILSLIIIVSVVTLVFFLETTKTNKTLICKYELSNYNETLYFEYNDGILIKFQRDTFANGTGDIKKKLNCRYC